MAMKNCLLCDTSHRDHALNRKSVFGHNWLRQTEQEGKWKNSFKSKDTTWLLAFPLDNPPVMGNETD